MGKLAHDLLPILIFLAMFSFVLICIAIMRMGYLKRLQEGMQNSRQLKIGNNIFIEGTIVSPDKYETPVLQIPVAAYFWQLEKKRGRNMLQAGKGQKGNEVDIQTIDGRNFYVQLDENQFAYRFSTINQGAANTWIWKSANVKYNHEISKRITDFVEAERIRTEVLGMNENMKISEYPLQYGQTYSVLGLLVAGNIIKGQESNELIIYSDPPETVLRKVRLHCRIFQFLGTTLAAIAIYFFYYLI